MKSGINCNQNLATIVFLSHLSRQGAKYRKVVIVFCSPFYSDAFTHGPTGPGPRGPLKILKLGGPVQKFEKLMNFANLDKDSFIGIVPRCTYSCIGVFNFSSFAVSNYFVDINLFGD